MDSEGSTCATIPLQVVYEPGKLRRRVVYPSARSGPNAATPCESILNVVRFEDLRIGPVLGLGRRGKARVCKHRHTLVMYALKYTASLCSLLPAQRDRLLSRVTQLATLVHENVVSLYEAFLRDNIVYSLGEFMDCGTLSDVSQRLGLRTFDEPRLAFCARDMLVGLAYLHHLGVAHVGVKPTNVLVNSKGFVKLSDLDLEKHFCEADFRVRDCLAVAKYMSREQAQCQPRSQACDVWGVGVTIAELALGAQLFAPTSIMECLDMLTATPLVVHWPARSGSEHSAELKDFVTLCLLPAASRPSAAALLNHPFISLANILHRSEMGKWFFELRPLSPPQQH